MRNSRPALARVSRAILMFFIWLRRRWRIFAIDALAAAVAGMCVWLVAGQTLRPSMSTASLLFDVPGPTALACIGQLLLAGVLLVKPRSGHSRWIRRLALAVLVGFAANAWADSAGYFVLWAQGRIAPSRWLPLSFYLGLLLTARSIQWLRHRPAPEPPAGTRRWRRIVATTALAAAGAMALPLLEQVFFGSTRYIRSADVGVVFGAGVHADGSPSDALADRVRTGVQLYKAGQTRALLMTGGIDPAHGLSEPQVMRRLAIKAGVPAEAIVLDEGGANTSASIRNLAAILPAHGWRNCLLVSHDFHLSRIKRQADRLGVAGYTVPAVQQYRLCNEAFYRLREVAAWHVYLLSIAGR